MSVFLAIAAGIMTSTICFTAPNEIQPDAAVPDIARVATESGVCIHAYSTAAQPWRRL